MAPPVHRWEVWSLRPEKFTLGRRRTRRGEPVFRRSNVEVLHPRDTRNPMEGLTGLTWRARPGARKKT
jgi:hypothetical protein